MAVAASPSRYDDPPRAERTSTQLVKTPRKLAMFRETGGWVGRTLEETNAPIDISLPESISQSAEADEDIVEVGSGST